MRNTASRSPWREIASVGSRPTGRPSIDVAITLHVPAAVAPLRVAQSAGGEAVVIDGGERIAAPGHACQIGAGRPYREIHDLRRGGAARGEGRRRGAQERAGDEDGERAHRANADVGRQRVRQ